jgi:membrane protease YdiL (CAAX protease family)
MTRSTAAWLAALVLVVAAFAAVSWGWQGDDEDGAFHLEVTTQGKMILVQAEIGAATGQKPPLDPQFFQMELLERKPPDRIYRAIVRAEVGQPEKALEIVRALPAGTPDANLLERLYGGGKLSVEEREGLSARRGWFGRLAAVYGLPDEEPRRAKMLATVQRAARVSLVLSVLALPALLLGFVLFIRTLIKLKQGTLRGAFRLHDEGAGDLPWLQVTVLGLAVVLALNIGLLSYTGISPLITMWLPLVPLAWPVWRRMRASEWRGGLGLTRGAGVLREVGAGIVGYLAGIPFVILGALVTARLTELTGSKASHPLSYETLDGQGTPTWMIVMSACVWAPVIEELLFRGALYRYLRPGFSVVGSASLTALGFALVHPQGLVGVPAIWALGVVFACLREWRGSIVAPMTAHAIHNGVLVLMLLAVFA